jgi:hypothetical protein
MAAATGDYDDEGTKPVPHRLDANGTGESQTYVFHPAYRNGRLSRGDSASHRVYSAAINTCRKSTIFQSKKPKQYKNRLSVRQLNTVTEYSELQLMGK